MRTTIQVMPPDLQNQIAAGEVVERPASVVKELVENALDAGATRILVEVKGGGKGLIRVVDNGFGMAPEDARLSLQRHATSKLMSLDDLRAIRTFGFRGEALPSIASVCRFTLRTRHKDAATGLQLTLHGGGEIEEEEVSMARGTEILVEDLFFNVPARRKFLRKDSTEVQHITETVQRMALAHHRVHFSLQSETRKILSAPAENDPMARIYSIFGKKVCAGLYECFVEGPVTVSGFISEPAVRKRGTSGLFTYVNGRFVRDKLIIQAIRKGYGTLLGSGDYPYAVLDIHVPVGELDVNVHPTKIEVRFERSREVFGAVQRAVQVTLADNPHIQRAVEEATQAQSSFPGGHSPFPAPPRRDPSLQFMPRSTPIPPVIPGSNRFQPDPQAWEVSPQPVSQGLPQRLSDMRYLGQYARCYLLGQLGQRLVLIDQHAAHERILFEQLRRQFQEKKVVVQNLLVPMLIELDPSQMTSVDDKQELLLRLGFVVEPFGGNTAAIKGAPMLLGQRSPERPLKALLDELEDVDSTTDTVELFHKPISTMACHSAVRSGDPMDREEVAALLKQMDDVDLAAFCPHGRPVIVFLEHGEVARWFNRT